MTNPYGFCPECGQPGTIRARDTIATTYCANGHRWLPPKGTYLAIQQAFVRGAEFVRLSSGGRTFREIEDTANKYRATFEEPV